MLNKDDERVTAIRQFVRQEKTYKTYFQLSEQTPEPGRRKASIVYANEADVLNAVKYSAAADTKVTSTEVDDGGYRAA